MTSPAEPDAEAPRSDALVVFGFTGDLVAKKILPALYALARKGALAMPVIGVASATLGADAVAALVEKSLERAGPIDDAAAFDRLLSAIRYVGGDYRMPATFAALRDALGAARRPLHYLAIPQDLFETVIRGLGEVGLAADARVVVEKPFGRDLASARQLAAVASAVFPERSIFRIDHYLGKEAIMNLTYFRFANAFLEPIWNRDHIASVQVTIAEKFGIEDRGTFYESAGALRDVVQNHLFQIVALLAMEPPADASPVAIQNAKAAVLHAIRPLAPPDIVRGQYAGYRDEKDVAADSDVETFCAVRLYVDSWRWAGVPWFLRAGKCLPTTAGEVLVRLKPPPQRLFGDSPVSAADGNHLRFELQPNSVVVLAARVKRAGHDFVGDRHEFELSRDLRGEEPTYERLLGDAMAGDATLFSSQDTVEAAWAVVEPVLNDHPAARPYAEGTWGPAEAAALIDAEGGWHDPVVDTS